MSTKKTLLAILVLAAIVSAYYFYRAAPVPGPGTMPGPVACTLEAKLCPDGSSVGRTGPNCEFAACPTATSTAVDTTNWKTYRNDKYGFEFKYPAEWQYKYETPNTIVIEVSPEIGRPDTDDFRTKFGIYTQAPTLSTDEAWSVGVANHFYKSKKVVPNLIIEAQAKDSEDVATANAIFDSFKLTK